MICACPVRWWDEFAHCSTLVPGASYALKMVDVHRSVFSVGCMFTSTHANHQICGDNTPWSIPSSVHTGRFAGPLANFSLDAIACPALNRHTSRRCRGNVSFHGDADTTPNRRGPDTKNVSGISHRQPIHCKCASDYIGFAFGHVYLCFADPLSSPSCLRSTFPNACSSLIHSCSTDCDCDGVPRHALATAPSGSGGPSGA
jgi:hypothetical protein